LEWRPRPTPACSAIEEEEEEEEEEEGEDGVSVSLSINVCRLAGDTLNNTCNILYCNHQVHRDFLITLYIIIYRSYRHLILTIFYAGMAL
jgi:hypothetical protein